MAQYPDIDASDELTVELLRSMLPNYIFKDNAETRASTTTVADDSDLIVPVEASARYIIRFTLHAAATTTADIKTAWSAPSGAAGNKHVLGPGSTAADGNADNISARLGVHGMTTEITYSGVRNSAALQFLIIEEAMVIIGGTAGNVAFRWAQATSNATGSVVAASWAEYRRVA